MNHFKNQRLLVKKILEQPFNYEWSAQGLGMLRLYLAKELRLHIWHSVVKTKASIIHTHPWDFESLIVTGKLDNTIYPVMSAGYLHLRGQQLRCGEGGGLVGEPRDVTFGVPKGEVLVVGETYCQRSDEIHSTAALDGTVTLVSRTFFDDENHAVVYWEADSEFISAEPRLATEFEIAIACQDARKLLG